MASAAKMLHTILQLESLFAKYISKIGRNLHKFEKKKNLSAAAQRSRQKTGMVSGPVRHSRGLSMASWWSRPTTAAMEEEGQRPAMAHVRVSLGRRRRRRRCRDLSAGRALHSPGPVQYIVYSRYKVSRYIYPCLSISKLGCRRFDGQS
jgi:hypothetical protein